MSRKKKKKKEKQTLKHLNREKRWHDEETFEIFVRILPYR